jgi:hypothetical protein
LPLSAFAQTPQRNLLPLERKPAPGFSDAASLLRAQRRALVIGNSSYRFAPLRNPANDARALGEELGRMGFEVTATFDLPRKEMMAAIAAYVEAVARARAVGVFYFAGHGLQLAWRNYLVPVDASIQRLDDIPAMCVDVNAVIEGIGRAANPMNVIILDACRENPFARDVPLEQKGLSQVDAPPGTLLAYATSPGNLASDGEGANGLYTEQLLREMRVPETKIEDMFKRVRLAVRKRSNGRQIPWESTSLEQDFWFIPPKELRAQSEREAERQFREEAALWEKVRTATTPVPLEDYLRRYPSGRFAEIAQAQLDRILAQQGEARIEAVSAPQNPYTLGSAVARTDHKLGDTYTYNLLDEYSRVVHETVTQRITGVTPQEVTYDDGKMITDLLGNWILQRDGRSYTPYQMLPAEFVIGRRWDTRYTVNNPTRGLFHLRFELRVTGRERIRVPAGSFDAFRIDGRGMQYGTSVNGPVEATFWCAPQLVRRPVASSYITRMFAFTGRADREELAAFKES